MKATKPRPLGLPQMRLVTEHDRQVFNREVTADQSGSNMAADEFVNMLAAELFDEGRKVTRIEFLQAPGYLAAIYYNV